jgi:hypothetical protein
MCAHLNATSGNLELPAGDDGDDALAFPPCPACLRPLALLGVLGTVAHYCCRSCGLTACRLFDTTA